MKRLTGVIKDFMKCVLFGSFISLVITFVVGIISLLVSKFNWQQSLESIRSALLIIGPLGMILGAILILKKKDEKELLFIDQWKKKYNEFSYKIVLILVSCIIVLYGGVIDWIIFSFKIIN